MAGSRYIPNETSNRVLYAGFENPAGTDTTPDFRLTGEFAASESSALNRDPEVTGGYDRMATPKKTPSTFSGTYAEKLTYETFPQLLRAGVRAGDAGVLVPSTAAVYEYDKAPTFDRDDIEAMTVDYYVPGLGMRAKGVRFNEFTVGMDSDGADGAWNFSSNLFLRGVGELPGAFEGVATAADANSLTMTGAGWTVDEHAGGFVFLNPGTHDGQVREIVSNTATVLTVAPAFDPVPAATVPFRIEGQFPVGIPIPDNETIDAPGTRIYLDPVGALGTNQIRNRLISWNVTVAHGLSPKRFAEHGRDEISDRVGKGDRLVSGQVRLEFDRRDEWLQWRKLQELAIRFEQDGSEIEAGQRKRARIDLARVLWDTVTPDTRQSNLTATFAFLAYLPTSDPIVRFVTRNGLPTLA